MLLGIVLGGILLAGALIPAMHGQRSDSSQAAMGGAILFGSLILFWQYHG
jgi:hypothetical protein